MLGEPEQASDLEIKPGIAYDFAQLFVANRADLDRQIDPVLGAIEYNVILWISYPKGSSGVETDLNRDKLWRALGEKGIRAVTQVSVDEVCSAMRFRPEVPGEG